MTSQMSKPMLNPVAVIDYWDLRSQIKTKQRQNCRYFHPQQSSTGSRSSLQNVNREQFRRFPPGLWRVGPSGQDGFTAKSSIAKQKPGTGNWMVFPRGGLICYLKTNDLKSHLKSWKFHPLSVLKILRCS